MPTQMESVCCYEIEKIRSLLEADSHIEIPPSCITLHADFHYICLHRGVLTVSLYAHRHWYEGVEVPADENRYRIFYYCYV